MKKNTTKTSSKNVAKLQKLTAEQLKQIAGGAAPVAKPATY